MSLKWRTVFVVAVLFCIVSLNAHAMTSANFNLIFDSANSGGTDTSTSTNFGLRDTVGEGGTGEISSTNFAVYSGYRAGDSVTTSAPGGSGGGGSGSSGVGGGGLPVVLSSIVVTSITKTSAIISWTTDHAANSFVKYGFTTSYASGTVSDSSMLTIHSLTITGLTPGTLYHFIVTSTDSSGVSATSADATFTTTAPPDTTPPVISNIRVTSITEHTGVIAWDTNENASTLVSYGTTISYGSGGSAPGLTITHTFPLTGLTDGTLYHFFVTSADSLGNTATSTDRTFSTSPDITPPANVSSFTAAPGDTKVTLNWISPTDSDFAGTRLIRKTSGFPSDPLVGTVVYIGKGTSKIDTGLTNGIMYFYGAYAFDAKRPPTLAQPRLTLILFARQFPLSKDQNQNHWHANSLPRRQNSLARP